MASLFDRNGTWYAQFYKSERSPSRKRLSLRTKQKREARRKLTELEDAFRQGEFDPWGSGTAGDPFAYQDAAGSKPTLSTAQAIDAFAEEKELEGRAKRTVSTYRNVWGRFVDRVGAGKELAEITLDHIHNYIHDRSVSESTRHKRWRHVRAVLNWAECDVVDEVNPPQKPDKLPTPVRDDDLSTVISALKKEYREKRRKRQCRPGQMIWAIPVFRFAFYTGLRASEIGRLKWKHVDRDRGLIRIEEQKNNREQTVPLISKAEDVLDDAPCPRQPDYYIFRAPASPLRDRNEEAFGRQASRTFCKARKRSKVEGKTFHDLRAGFATALAEAGMSAHQIKEAMRHADISTSLKYVRVSRQRLRSEMESAF